MSEPTELQKAFDQALSSLMHCKKYGWTSCTLDAKQLQLIYDAAKQFKASQNTIKYCAGILKDFGMDESGPLEKITRSIIEHCKTAAKENGGLRTAIKQLQMEAVGLIQERDETKSELKNCAVALGGGLLSLRHVVSALHATNSISPDARLAINIMKDALAQPITQSLK